MQANAHAARPSRALLAVIAHAPETVFSALAATLAQTA
jgi:hypothetical protein